MGTGILSTLLGLQSDSIPRLLSPAAALLVLGWTALVVLTVAYVGRIARDRAALTSTIRDPAVAPLWGTVSMGILAVGAATLTVVPRLRPAWQHAAVLVDGSLWLVGTLVGLAATFGFAALIITRGLSEPKPAWGLAVVPPMVSSTTAEALVPHLTSEPLRIALVMTALACFFVALGFAALIFVLAYRHHARVEPLPLAASTSAWIPLGVVGQSMAAAQAMAGQADGFLTAGGRYAIHALADAYGFAMLAVAVPVVAFALRTTVAGFAGRMPFSPGWWALTFPIGTLVLGTRFLGASTGLGFVTAISHVVPRDARGHVDALLGRHGECAAGPDETSSDPERDRASECLACLDLNASGLSGLGLGHRDGE